MSNNNRVQIPAYTDRWMMGDQYGELVKTSHMLAGDIHPSIRPRAHAATDQVEVAHVKLDKSGKTGRYILLDCTAV